MQPPRLLPPFAAALPYHGARATPSGPSADSWRPRRRKAVSMVDHSWRAAL